MNQINETKLREDVKIMNGECKKRIIREEDIQLFLSELETNNNNDSVRTIRVYPRDAFVSRSYSFQANCVCLEALKYDNGWNVAAIRRDAHRQFGKGKRITINGQ